jgi:hypothetical protein
MRLAKLSPVLIALFALSGFLLFRSSNPSHAHAAQASSSACCGQGNLAMREIDFPYYSLRDGFTSTLNLVSDSPQPTDLTIAVRSLLGHSLLSHQTIQSQAKLPVDLGGLIAKLGSDPAGEFAEGSVAVYFMGTIMPVVGQLTIANPALRLIHESEMVENDLGRSDIPPVLNSSWWGLGGGRDARIMIANFSGNQVAADVWLEFGGQRHPAPPLLFAPDETKVLSLNQMLGQIGVSPAEAPAGGITIVQRGPNPRLIAEGKILDPVTGFSTTLSFPDPARQQASALHVSGIPIGTPTTDSPFAGTGTFIPHVIARNLLSASQNVTVTLEYADQKGKPAQTVLAPLSVAGLSTEDFTLDAVMGQLPLPLPYVSLRMEHSGPPGSLVAQVSSVEAKSDLVVDAHVANEGDGWAGSGANPWRLDGETESILFLTNMGGQEARIGFVLTANGVHYYLTKLKLEPRETKAIDIRKLRDKQEADFKKNKIPAGASDGSVNWVRMDNAPVMGRLVVIQRHKGVSSGYDCNTCPCSPGFTGTLSIAPSTIGVTPTTSMGCSCTATYQDCNGVQYPYDETTFSTWSSDNSAIATVNPSGQVQGVSAGSTYIKASFTGYQYYYEPMHGGCVRSSPINGSTQSTCNVSPNYGCADPLNSIIQQYYDYPTGSPPYIPGCTSFTNSGHTTNFTFAELNVNQEYPWAILTSTFLTGLQNTRNVYGAMTVSSGYREPAYNHTIDPTAPGSRHVFGDAADIASTQSTWQELHDDAKQNGACVEPVNYTGQYDWTHVHMDWRGTCPNGW